MLIARLIHKERQAVDLYASQWQKQHTILQTQFWLFKKSLTRFCATLPALGLSFSAGFIMQSRRNGAVKTVRRLVGFGWLRSMLR